ELCSEQIRQVSVSVAEYISNRRDQFRERVAHLSTKQESSLAGFFRSDLLDATPILVLEQERIGNPDFYPALRGMGFSNLPASAPTTKRIFNFNAGPAALPLPVLERIRGELLDWRGSGMSVMEMSHRSPEYESINASAEQKLRSLLAIPEDYAVIFVQGGGSLQFSMAPMNLCLPGKPVDVLHTGAWTAKAIGELKKGFSYNVAASTESEKFARLPRPEEFNFSRDASYVHICTNNTIEGTQWTAIPDTGNVPLVSDMS